MLKFPEFTFTIEMFDIGTFTYVMKDDKLTINELEGNPGTYALAIAYYELMKEMKK